MSKIIYDITPVSKPRMTQRDKWAKRPTVLKYRAFCDEVRGKVRVEVKSCSTVIFRVPMPKSWSNKKIKQMDGKPHQQKPDVDNLLKAWLDANMDDDSSIYDIRAIKVWAKHGSIEVIEGINTI